MILAIDIGNTNIVLGCADGDKILFRERLATVQRETSLEYAVKIKAALDINDIKRDDITGAIISSVVPSVTFTVKTAVEKLVDGRIMVVGPGIKTGLSIQIDNPAQLGSDLVVDAVAGIHEYPVPQVLIDMGTATTFSVIDRNRTYIGGLRRRAEFAHGSAAEDSVRKAEARYLLKHGGLHKERYNVFQRMRYRRHNRAH